MKKKPVLICIAALVTAVVLCAAAFAVKAAQPKNDVFTDAFFENMDYIAPMKDPVDKKTEEKIVSLLKSVYLESTEESPISYHVEDLSDLMKMPIPGPGNRWHICFQDGSVVYMCTYEAWIEVRTPTEVEGQNDVARYYAVDKNGDRMTDFDTTIFYLFHPESLSKKSASK